MRLTWTQVQQVHRWRKNTNLTIAEMARKLDCPSVWVVWALEGQAPTPTGKIGTEKRTRKEQ